MSSGASIALAELTAQAGLDRDETIELAVRYILSGIELIELTKRQAKSLTKNPAKGRTKTTKIKD
jgi:hypothetical protein